MSYDEEEDLIGGSGDIEDEEEPLELPDEPLDLPEDEEFDPDSRYH